jgi:hypothetical protein
MNWNDYEAIWKRQELPVGAGADLTDLRATFETKRRKLARGLFVRDLIEGFGGALLALAFGTWAWRTGRAGWPFAVGVLLILGVASVFLHSWLRSRRTRLGPEAALLVRLDLNIAELRHQRRLLDNIGKWYLTPYVIAIGLMGWDLSRYAGRRAPPGLMREMLTAPLTLAWILVLLLVILWAFWWWWRGIQHVVHQRIDPRLEELMKMRRDVLAPTDRESPSVANATR